MLVEEARRVTLWHPWQDKPGQRHKLTLWSTGHIGQVPISSVEELIGSVAHHGLYTFCNDVFDVGEFPFSDELLNHPKSEAYISRSGQVVALKLKSKRKAGFLLPASTWKWDNTPTKEMIDHVQNIFRQFGYEALTPSSLSEKVLRATLPDHTFISRPSEPLRRVLLANSTGGRIDRKEIGQFYPVVYTYDMNKAYLYMSGDVPSPFHCPVFFSYGRKQQACYERWQDFAYAYCHVVLTVHGSGLHPIQVKEGGVNRVPMEGEQLDIWLWNFEISDCLAKGYTLQHMYEGYGWYDRSDFMQQWADILYDHYTNEPHPYIREIHKGMMVGLPGRFLKAPETYTLIHESDVRVGDIPIILRWLEENPKKVTTDWYIRAEYDINSAQLTPIGHCIIAKCRKALYDAQKEEVRCGNRLVRSYIDSYSVELPTTQPENLGTERGQWKEKIDYDAWIEENRVIPVDIDRMKAPGYSGDERFRLWNSIHRKGIVEQHGTTQTQND